METNFEIACPCCGENINVKDVLQDQLIDQLKTNLQDEENEFIKKHLSNLEQKSNKELMKIRAEHEAEINQLKEELTLSSNNNKELNKTKAELIKLKREIREKKELAEIEVQEKIQDALDHEYERLTKLANQKNELEIKALTKQLNDQKALTNEMKRKQEQGSVQLQGEVGELLIEDWLKEEFRFDEIIEIKKGENGADCLQVINNHEAINCGTIYYESKCTKTFQNSWIEKFKNDIKEKGADVGVLVTKTMPNGFTGITKRNGIIICGFNEFKIIAPILRDSLIQLKYAKNAGENRTDKISMLYDFLTSNEFKLQLEGIVEGMHQMQDDLNRERKAITNLWKQREKQIVKVITNTVNMYGSIKGIAGKSIPEINSIHFISNE